MHGFDWGYVCTAAVTHAVLKLICEFATLSFRNLKQESFEDWFVIITRSLAFIMIPLFYGLEKSFNPDSKTPYFQALAVVYALAMCGVMTSVIKREPYMGGSAQFATPFRTLHLLHFLDVCVGDKVGIWSLSSGPSVA